MCDWREWQWAHDYTLRMCRTWLEQRAQAVPSIPELTPVTPDADVGLALAMPTPMLARSSCVGAPCRVFALRAGELRDLAKLRAGRSKKRPLTDAERDCLGFTAASSSYVSPDAHRPRCFYCGRRPGKRVWCVYCHEGVGPGCCLLVEFTGVSRARRYGICVHCLTPGRGPVPCCNSHVQYAEQ